MTIVLALILVACTQAPAPQGEPAPDLPASTATATIAPSPTPTLPPPPEQIVSDGDTALFMGDYQTAIMNFRDALERDDDPDLVAHSHLGLGQAYYHQGETSTGLNYLRQAAAAEKITTAARAQYMLGKTYTRLQRYPEALEAYQVYLDLQPGLFDEHVHELRGDLFTSLLDHTAAIESYQAAYLAHPGEGSEVLAVKIARAFQDSGDNETALSLYQDLYNTSSNDFTKAQMALLIGRILLERDETEQAYEIFRESVANYPFAFDAHTALVTLVNAGVEVNEYQRGLVNYHRGNHALAIAAFDRYLASAPESFRDAALYYKGLSTRSLGGSEPESNYRQALDLWYELIEDHPTSPFYVNAWQSIEFTLWAFLEEPGQAAEAALDFVAQRPDALEAPDFLFRAGRSYERAGMLEEAAQTWGRIASEYPDSPEAFEAVFFGGIAYVRLGDWAAAKPYFSRALVLASRPPEEAAAYLWIGKSQDAQGDISAALDSWKQAQMANPFGHYSIRAEDLLIGRPPFSEPQTYDLDPDLEPYRQEAEDWLRMTFDLPPDINLESPGMLAIDPRYQRAHEFWALGDYPAAKDELEALRVELAQDPAQTFRLIPALVEIGLYRSALVASSQVLRLAGMEGGNALSAPEYFSRIRFGAYYLDWLLPITEDQNISPLLLLSIMRQESGYEGFARSVAGARGLMQIMPDTGTDLANNLGWPEDYTVEDLYRPHVSLVFGANYFRQLHNYFEGDLYAILAAYNGGWGNTIVWKEMTPINDPDLFLEIVRLEETRNYIRLINEIHYIYGWLYGEPEER